MSIDLKSLPPKYQQQARRQLRGVEVITPALHQANAAPLNFNVSTTERTKTRTDSKTRILAFTIRSQLPSGKNAVKITRTGHRYPAKRFKDWKESAMYDIASQCDLREPLADPVKCTIRYFAGDKRRRDVPGMVDALFHVFEAASIVADDAHIREVHFTTEYDKANPRAEITLEAK